MRDCDYRCARQLVETCAQADVGAVMLRFSDVMISSYRPDGNLQVPVNTGDWTVTIERVRDLATAGVDQVVMVHGEVPR